MLARLLKGRVAMTARRSRGPIIGYDGRWWMDAAIMRRPRVQFPGKVRSDGKVFEFRKPLLFTIRLSDTKRVAGLNRVEGLPRYGTCIKRLAGCGGTMGAML